MHQDFLLLNVKKCFARLELDIVPVMANAIFIRQKFGSILAPTSSHGETDVLNSTVQFCRQAWNLLRAPHSKTDNFNY